MMRGAEGWFELTTDRVQPGGTYAFELPDGRRVPDPAARAQSGDVHAPSVLVDPPAYAWHTPPWQARHRDAAVIYELPHGPFLESGDFAVSPALLSSPAETGVPRLEPRPVSPSIATT